MREIESERNMSTINSSLYTKKWFRDSLKEHIRFYVHLNDFFQFVEESKID